MVQNIDIAPTHTRRGHVPLPNDAPHMDGQSFWPLLQGPERSVARSHPLRVLLGMELPATPTIFAIRTDRWKYIYHHGIWDIDALFDLETDPLERHNLIRVPSLSIADRRTAERATFRTSGEIGRTPHAGSSSPQGEPLHDRKLPP